MARSTTKSLLEAGRAPFQGRMGPLGPGVAGVQFDRDYDNDYAVTYSDVLDLNSLEALRVDSDGRVRIDQSALLGARQPMLFPLALNAGLATQTFFIADRTMVITGLSEIHATAGTDGSAVTMQISHESGVQAPGTGTIVQTNSFNLKGTANTVQNATLLAPLGTGGPATGLLLLKGDRLSAVFTGTLTTLAGVVVTAMAAPGSKEQTAVYIMNANASIATQTFAAANRDLTLVGVQAIWSAAGTDAGTVTVDVFKDTGTQAPGGGVSVLAAALSVKTAANTTMAPALNATATRLSLAAGDRLSVVLTGTLTALAGVCLVAYFAPIYNRIEIPFTMHANGGMVSQRLFTADRDYEVLEASEIHGTAGTDGGAVTTTVTIDKGVTAPGAGVNCLTTTFNEKSTANTTVFLSPTTALHTRLLSKGDGLSVLFTGTVTALADVEMTISLAPR